MQPRMGVRLLDAVLPQGLVSDLPLVIAGAMGTGRTVLSLEIAAACVQRNEPVTMLLAEPGEGALQEAASLGLDLDPALRGGALVLLEMDDQAADLAHREGLAPLADALLAESSAARTIIVDPISSLIPDLFDERAGRKLLRPFLERLRQPGRRIVLTYDSDSGRGGRGFDRVLADLAAAYIELERGPRGHVLKLSKVRGPGTRLPRIEFAIGAGGSYPLSSTLGEPVAPTPTEPPQSARTRADRPRVVVALENDDERAAVQSWLCDSYELLAVNDGLRALSLSCTQGPSLLLLEPQLRGASGYEVLRALRGSGLQLPVLVALHQKARAVDRVRPLVLGATDVIAKPFNSFELVHRIRTLLQLSSDSVPRTTDEAELLFMVRNRSRLVNESDFHDHVSRAVSIGERFGFPSTLLYLETEDDETFQVLAASADHLLRVEDAFCPLTERRAAVLLVCAGESQSRAIVERVHRDLMQRTGEAPAHLGWTARPARMPADVADREPDVSAGFKDLEWLRDPSAIGALRLVTRHG